jgi:hypothetical protein
MFMKHDSSVGLHSSGNILTFEALIAVTMKTIVFWAVTPCNVVRSDDTHKEFCLLDPENGGQYFSPKRRVTSTRLRGLTSQKTVFFIKG